MSDRALQDKIYGRDNHSRTYVCASCLEDEALRQFANQRGAVRGCDYCGHTPLTASVVRLEDVIELMDEAISEEWCDPANTSPVDHGEYVLKTIDAEELFYKIGFELSNQDLWSDILVEFSDHDWCNANWQILSPSKRWGYGWERFQHVVKHERRYTFWYSKDDFEDPFHPDYLPPADVLGEIESVISETPLVKVMPVGTFVWRLQVHSKVENIVVPDRFTSPPIHLATQPNRMSPAGVPMFYGCDDFDTARLELISPGGSDKGKHVSGVIFKNIVPLNILDLTSLPASPSYFSPKGPYRRHFIRFLRKFVNDLSKPIQRDGRQHIEYVPTQVFTEFVRHIMKGPEGISIQGLRYSSSQNGRPCYAIFATQAQCLPARGPLDSTKQILEFIPGSQKTLSIE
jgi:hypothetical protein